MHHDYIGKQKIITDWAVRTCLKCDKDFMSETKGNRICKKCKGRNEEIGCMK